MRLLVTADLHLGASLVAWGPQAMKARAEVLRAWDEAVDLVLDPEAGVDGVLVAGDLFDSPEPMFDALESVRRGLGRLTSAGKLVVILPGIYDGLASPRSIYNTAGWPRGVHLVTWASVRNVSIPFGGETLDLVTFAPLPRTERLSFDREALPPRAAGRYRVGLFHTVARPESPLVAWSTRLDPESLGGLDLDLLVVGGEHGRREALWGRTHLVSPGAPVPIRPSDPGPTFWTLVTLSGAGVEITCRERNVHLDPVPDPAVSGDSPVPGADDPAPGGLRAALLRVYEQRLQSGEDPRLLRAALRYGLEKLDPPEACHVD